MRETAFFFLLNLSWQVALVVCLAWAGLKLCRIQSPQMRRMVWLAVALSPVALAMLGNMPSNLSIYRTEMPNTHREVLHNPSEPSAFTPIPDFPLPAESNISIVAQPRRLSRLDPMPSPSCLPSGYWAAPLAWCALPEGIGNFGRSLPEQIPSIQAPCTGPSATRAGLWASRAACAFLFPRK